MLEKSETLTYQNWLLSAAAQLLLVSVEVTAEPTGGSAHLHVFYEAKEMLGQRQNPLLACRQSHVRSDWQIIAEALGFPYG